MDIKLKVLLNNIDITNKLLKFNIEQGRIVIGENREIPSKVTISLCSNIPNKVIGAKLTSSPKVIEPIILENKESGKSHEWTSALSFAPNILSSLEDFPFSLNLEFELA